MKTTERITNERLKALIAALCGFTLCFCLMVPSTGTLFAVADDSDQATATDDGEEGDGYTLEPVRWYMSGNKTKLEGGIELEDPKGPTFGYNKKDGSLVSLSEWGLELDKSTGKPYIPADELESFLAGSGLWVFPNRGDYDGPSASDVDWYQLYQRVEKPKSDSGSGGGQDGQPEQESTPEAPKADAEVPPVEANPEEDPTLMEELTFELEDLSDQTLPTAPIAPTKPNNQPSAPQRQSAEEIAPTPAVQSIRCRESEAEEKIAELEAQGCTIVGVEKVPSQ